MKLSTLTTLKEAKKDSSGVIKLVIFGVLLAVVLYATLRWKLQWRSLKKSEAELEIAKARLKENREIIENMEISAGSKRAYEFVIDHMENSLFQKEKRIRLSKEMLKAQKEHINAAKTWDELEDA